jgi:quinolinate synthase
MEDTVVEEADIKAEDISEAVISDRTKEEGTGRTVPTTSPHAIRMWSGSCLVHQRIRKSPIPELILTSMIIFLLRLLEEMSLHPLTR